jgi:hypothetical protein
MACALHVSSSDLIPCSVHWQRVRVPVGALGLAVRVSRERPDSAGGRSCWVHVRCRIDYRCVLARPRRGPAAANLKNGKRPLLQCRHKFPRIIADLFPVVSLSSSASRGGARGAGRDGGGRSDMWGAWAGPVAARLASAVVCRTVPVLSYLASQIWTLRAGHSAPARCGCARPTPPEVAPLDCRVNKARTAVCVHTRERLRERVSTRARPRHLWLEAPRLAGPRPTAAYGKAQRGHSSRRLPTPRSRYVR